MKGKTFRKNLVPAAIRLSAALCTATFCGSAETYYLNKANVSPTALADPQYWKTAGGTTCTAFSYSDDFVAKGIRAYLRPAQSSTGYFLGGSFSIGADGVDGAAMLYLKNASIGFDDYGEVAHGGLLLQRGLLDIGSVGARIFSGTVVGRVEVMAPKNAPFKIRCNLPYPYHLEIAAELDGDADSAFEFGSSLPQAISGIGSAGDSVTNIVLTISGDCESFLGTLAMTGAVNRAGISASGVPEEFASMLVLSNTVFSGEVVLNGGCVLSACDPSNVCSVGTLELRPNSVLMATGGVTRARNTGFPVSRTNAFFNVTQSCNIQGPIYLALPGCEAVPDGTTNRIALLSVPAGTNLDPSGFVIAGGGLPPIPHRFVVDVGQDGRKTLVCEVEPYAVLLTSDSANNFFSTVVSSALTNANAWSDGEVPHAGVSYIVQQRPSLPGTMCLQTLTDNVKNTQYNCIFPGRRLIIGPGCRLISRCGTFRSSDLPLQFLDGSYLIFCNFQCTRFIGGIDVGEGTVGINPYAGNRMDVDRLTGLGTVVAGSMLSNTDSVGGYYCFADASGFNGKISLLTTRAQAVDLSLNRCQHLYVSGDSLGGALESFAPDALYIANSSILGVDATCPTQTLANTVNRGVKVCGEGRIRLENSYDKLRIDWPVTYNGILVKEGAGTLVLGGNALFGDISADVPVSGGTNDIMLAAGTLAVASAGAVDGCRLVVSNGTSLVVSYSSDNADLLAHGLRNVKTTTPFVLEGTDRLPLAADFSEWDGLPPDRLTVGLITVTNNATTLESVRSMVSGRIGVSNFGTHGSVKATLDEKVDADAGLVTFRLTLRCAGAVISFR